MKFSFLIPSVTGILLFFTLIINFLALKFSVEYHFPEYIANIERKFDNFTELDPSGIRAVASIKTLDNETQKDYEDAFTELSNISSSLESLSKNPELYIHDNDKNIENPEPSATAFQLSFNNQPDYITEQTSNTLLGLFQNPFSFEANSHENTFFMQILRNLLLINGLWFVGILILHTLWIRQIFRPIHLINDHLRSIPNQKNFTKINYTHKNEFLPLITTLNELSSSLEQQEQIRNQFLSDLSHEIRTPMTAISCLLEAINDGIMELDALSISTLQNEMSRLVKITERIMKHENFLNAENFPTSRENFSLSEITENIITQYQPQLQKNHQKILQNFKKTDTLFANEEQYIQILHNIFSNFYKYAGEKTTLTCSLKTTKKENILIFEDDGAGIPEKDLPFIHEKFYRADIGRNQHSADMSMGIGFSIIEKIISLHHGKMHLENRSSGGLKISLYFPKIFNEK